MARRGDGAGRGADDRAAQSGQGARALTSAAAFVRGPSGPMLLSQIAAIWPEGIGPEGPPTTQPRGGSNISALGRNGRGA
ncbi:DUF6053 domain-containing protein [Lysobacter enzymogenes]|uniref:DUF6053 domain-containing protein n=1 Tax=Lysobacter enzymogenes TaxID=69 RepID=UPI003CCD0578